jgi:hypothetical protein
LQQHQLRLHLHVEATGGVEQVEQHVAEGDLGERFSKMGSSTVRMANSNSSTLVSGGTQPDSTCSWPPGGSHG